MAGAKNHLGHFDTPGQAHNAYCEAAKKYFGDFVNGDSRDNGPLLYLASFDCPAAAELASIVSLYKIYGAGKEAQHA